MKNMYYKVIYLHDMYDVFNNLIFICIKQDFEKTNQIVTPSLVHLIGPANSYTHKLPTNSAITRLG